MHKDFEACKALSRQNATLASCMSVLSWDQETYMPEGASGIRGQQLELLATLSHKARTSPEYATALSKLVDLKTHVVKPGLSPREAACVREWGRDYRIANALPSEFVAEFTKLTSTSLEAWKKAKSSKSFAHFSPYLDRIVQMLQKKAQYLGYKDHPYDALIDLYEPGVTAKQIKTVFAELKTAIVALLSKLQKGKKTDTSLLKGHYAHDTQLKLAKELLTACSYPWGHGRLDESAHPFSTSFGPTDARITTAIHEDNFLSSLTSTLHELGHSFYEMGLPEADFGTPLCEAISLGIHESQSRWWENLIGKSKAFWSFFLPKLKAHFPQLEKLDLDTFYKAINQVQPSYIRVDADELTYSLHVILRFEIEMALIDGSLKVKDLPKAWDAKFKELFGIDVPSIDKGCLQDVHWAHGDMGYFPTYALGNLFGAQFFATFAKEHKDWEAKVAKGETEFIRLWLKDKIHQHGRQFSAQELCEKITGEPLNAKYFVDYLNNKFGPIYS